MPVGILYINLYRDDLSTVSHQPVLNATDIPFDVTAPYIVLMDDVLYTGRTIRAALDALFDQGRAARVHYCWYLHRPRGIAKSLSKRNSACSRIVQTTDSEIIEVKFQEIDGMEKVLMVEKTE